MDNSIKLLLANSIRDFRLPRYEELPDVGLYLEQTVKYINKVLEPLGCMEITGSMVRNYVKQDLVKNPVRKLYFADQIAHLICVTMMKQVAPLEYIRKLFTRQKGRYTNEVAFDYFCNELENVLFFRFGLKDSIDDVGVTSSIEKEMLRSAITAVSHIIYLNSCFTLLSKESTEEI